MALARRLIPCLDVKDGRVVKGVHFAGLRDAGDPVELAAFYDQQGADELVYLDITASAEGRSTFLDVVQRVSRQVFIPLTVGGGIRSLEDIQAALRAGADKVAINTAAVQDPDLIGAAARAFGSQCIVVAIDARRVAAPDSGAGQGEDPCASGLSPEPETALRWEVYTHGGRTPTGRDAVAWAREAARRGAGEILLTSMDADGTCAGYDNALNRAVAEAVDIPVIASGGAGSLQHILEAFVEGKASAVLAASIFHYGLFTLQQAKEFLAARGVPVRLSVPPQTPSASLSRRFPAELSWPESGLLPAVVQDAGSGQVLMLAYMNREALQRTLDSGESWFYSRSRKTLWHKGETSGNRQIVQSITADCDGDTLLLQVRQLGTGACHTGARSCFFRPVARRKETWDKGGTAMVQEDGGPQVLAGLWQTVCSRREQAPEGSYTAYLFRSGLDKILKKVGEETTELVVAAKNLAFAAGGPTAAGGGPAAGDGGPAAAPPVQEAVRQVACESADLLYHLLVLWAQLGLEPAVVWEELRRRRTSPDQAPSAPKPGKGWVVAPVPDPDPASAGGYGPGSAPDPRELASIH